MVGFADGFAVVGFALGFAVGDLAIVGVRVGGREGTEVAAESSNWQTNKAKATTTKKSGFIVLYKVSVMVSEFHTPHDPAHDNCIYVQLRHPGRVHFCLRLEVYSMYCKLPVQYCICRFSPLNDTKAGQRSGSLQFQWSFSRNGG
jgi:hypothetical protein